MKSSRSPAVVLAALQGIVAIPSPQPVQVTRQSNSRPFAKGDLHLVNCEPRNSSEAGPVSTQWLSLVIYCENSTDCSDAGYVPAERDICVKKASNVSGDYQRWENSEWQTCRFAERGPFSWVLVRLARLFPPTTEVGIGEDEDKRDFKAFRDDEREGAGPVTHSCSKLFYLSLEPETAPASDVAK